MLPHKALSQGGQRHPAHWCPAARKSQGTAGTEAYPLAGSFDSGFSEIPAEAVSNNDNYEEEELNLPKFDDLPTVSSLTKDGSIKNENNSQEPVTVNSNVSSFWGNDADDFEFPEINSWGDK